MGQGGYITLVNATPYDWVPGEQSAYQMNTWSFPTIPAWCTRKVEVEWNEQFLKTKSDDSGTVTYTLSGTGATFQVRAQAPNGYDLTVVLTNIATLGNQCGDTIDLGWQHNGEVHWILAGEPNRFVSGKQTGAWMQANLDVLGTRTLRQLCIPGSHDAGMSTFGASTAFASKDNTQTQLVGILAQLRFGVRYFDIRPVISGGEYYTGHYSSINLGITTTWQGANGQSIASIVSDVNAYTARNEELVILHLSHDINTDAGNSSYPPFTRQEWDTLLSQLSRINGLYVTSETDLTHLTLNQFIARGAAVVVIVEPSDSTLSLSLPSGFYGTDRFTIYNSYADTADLAQMQSDQLQKMRSQRSYPDAGYFLLSWTLTDSTALRQILAMASQANMALPVALMEACTPQCYPNIIYIDRVENSDTAALAMAVNRLALTKA